MHRDSLVEVVGGDVNTTNVAQPSADDRDNEDNQHLMHIFDEDK